MTGCARGLVQTHIVVEWIGEVLAKGRIRDLVINKFAFRGKRKILEVCEAYQGQRFLRLLDFLRIESVARKNTLKAHLQTGKLVSFDEFASGGFQVIQGNASFLLRFL